MEWLVWIGAIFTVVGLVGIVISAVLVARARKAAGTDDADLRARLGKILPVNLGSLFLSVIGLMTVMVGVLLS